MTNVTLSTARIRRVDQLAWYRPIEVSCVLGFLEMSKMKIKIKTKKSKRWKVKKKKYTRPLFLFRSATRSATIFPFATIFVCFEFLFHTPRLKCNVGYFENTVCICKSIVFSKRVLIGFKIVKLYYRRRREKGKNLKRSFFIDITLGGNAIFRCNFDRRGKRLWKSYIARVFFFLSFSPFSFFERTSLL